ncbi:helix-turn-helix domain-containing protein [Gluconobacter wancherniae]|uniref:helix-turn-helix domain-containing protein n=1 Tax=Gluconobacter wancherniae TaxID=1307955 RepID=UPI0038D0C2B5
MVRRAQIILASADGETNTAIARRLGTTNPMVWAGTCRTLRRSPAGTAKNS